MSIHEDLELNLRERLGKVISDYVDLCSAANIPQDEAMLALIYTLGSLTAAIAASVTTISPEKYGELCAKSLDRYKRRAERHNAK